MAKPTFPKSKQKQLWELLGALRRGERLTVLQAIGKLGILALSQRTGELRRLGWPVRSRLITTRTGKHIAEYWMAR